MMAVTFFFFKLTIRCQNSFSKTILPGRGHVYVHVRVCLNYPYKNDLFINLRVEGARPSLMELFKKAEKADNSKPESADTEIAAEELGDEGMPDSNSDFMKQRSVSDSTFVVALIATVTFTAAFTVPGGFKSQDGADEGSALLSKKTSDS